MARTTRRQDTGSTPTARRSGKWPEVRKAHLRGHPECAACGGRELLEVHHVRPFHLFPELELSEDNLVTLCEGKAHNCHLIFGHSLSWECWNPDVRHDAAAFRGRVATRRTGR